MSVAGTGGGVFIQYLLNVFLNCVVNVQFKSTSDHWTSLTVKKSALSWEIVCDMQQTLLEMVQVAIAVQRWLGYSETNVSPGTWDCNSMLILMTGN